MDADDPQQPTPAPDGGLYGFVCIGLYDVCNAAYKALPVGTIYWSDRIDGMDLTNQEIAQQLGQQIVAALHRSIPSNSETAEEQQP